MESNPITESLAALLAELPSPHSRRAYTTAWRRYAEWAAGAGVDLLKARPRDVSAHLIHMREGKKVKATISHALSVIREVYGALVRDEVLETNPAREVKSPKMEKNPKTPWLRESEVKQLLSVPAATWDEKRERICAHLLLGLGFRRAEVARLRVEDFKNSYDDAGTQTVTALIKGGRTVIVGVPEWLQNELVGWYEHAGIESGPLLPRSQTDKRAVTGDIVYKLVLSLAARAGVKISPHGLRRTKITLEGERGVSLKERQLAVGHVSQGTTERYDHARDAAKNAPGQVLADLVGVQSKTDD